MIKIALTGSTGLVGSRIVELLADKFDFIPITEEQMDITDKDRVWQILKTVDFDLFLHLAAYTNVDEAQTQKILAHEINVEGTKNVFDVVYNLKKKFIYISTDFVFDGNKHPYFENSQPSPISYYGQTKYEGEKIVKEAAMIVRLSYPYRAHFPLKRDFVKNVRYLLEQKKVLNMVTDSLITPTFIDDIALALKYLFNNYSTEIFHLVGADSLSPYESGKLVAKVFNLDDSLIQPTTYQEYFKNKAKRPKYSVIRSKKNNFHRMKTFEEGLKEIKKDIRS